MYDYNIYFHNLAVTGQYSKTYFGVLAEENKTLRYIKFNENAAVFSKIEKIFCGWQKLEKAKLYGISLTGLDIYSDATELQKLKNSRFVLNSAALLANWIKKRFSACVIIGNDELPKEAYHAILAKYPCFDFAVYGRGEASVLKLSDHLAGKPVKLSHVLEKTTHGIIDYPGDMAPVSKGSADYKGCPIKMYTVPQAALLERYDPSVSKFLNKKGSKPQLILPYQFDDSCRGKCAFCPDGDFSFKSSNTVAQTFENLCRLKELGATGIYFVNNNFNNTYKFADELCDKMIKSRLNLLWCDCVNCRELDEKLLAKMRKAGAVKLTFGMETGSRRLLRFIRKGISTELIEKYLRYSNYLGIWNTIELIAGMPSETSADVKETAAFLETISPLTDTYALTRFRLMPSSPFGRKPGEFGLRLRSRGTKGTGLPLSSEIMREIPYGFDEISGLHWPEKQKQIYSAEHELSEVLYKHKYIFDTPQHLYLLMFLYRKFGYSNKRIIRKFFWYAARQYKSYHSNFFTLRWVKHRPDV